MSSAPLSVLFCQPTAGRSGSEHSLVQILRSLDPDRVRAHVLVGAEGPMLGEFEKNAAGVTVVPATKLSRSPRSLVGFLLSFPRLALALRRLRRQHALDAVHVNTLMFPQAMVAARLAGLPVVTHVREVRTTYPGRVYDAYLGLALRLSSRLLCVCRSILEQPVPDPAGLAASATVIYNASDFEPAPPRPGHDPLRMVSILPCTERKGLLDLVQALCLLREERPEASFELTIVGSTDREPGTQAAALEALERGGIASCVHFAGEQRNVSPYLRSADVLVHPSHTEAFPRVLVEAMNAGLPCIATGVGGSAEAVEDGRSGRIVPARNPGALAGALAELIDGGQELHGRWAREAFARYERHFTPRTMGEAIMDELERAAGRPLAGPGSDVARDERLSA